MVCDVSLLTSGLTARWLHRVRRSSVGNVTSSAAVRFVSHHHRHRRRRSPMPIPPGYDVDDDGDDFGELGAESLQKCRQFVANVNASFDELYYIRLLVLAAALALYAYALSRLIVFCYNYFTAVPRVIEVPIRASLSPAMLSPAQATDGITDPETGLAQSGEWIPHDWQLRQRRLMRRKVTVQSSFRKHLLMLQRMNCIEAEHAANELRDRVEDVTPNEPYERANQYVPRTGVPQHPQFDVILNHNNSRHPQPRRQQTVDQDSVTSVDSDGTAAGLLAHTERILDASEPMLADQPEHVLPDDRRIEGLHDAKIRTSLRCPVSPKYTNDSVHSEPPMSYYSANANNNSPSSRQMYLEQQQQQQHKSSATYGVPPLQQVTSGVARPFRFTEVVRTQRDPLSGVAPRHRRSMLRRTQTLHGQETHLRFGAGPVPMSRPRMFTVAHTNSTGSTESAPDATVPEMIERPPNGSERVSPSAHRQFYKQPSLPLSGLVARTAPLMKHHQVVHQQQSVTQRQTSTPASHV